MLLYRIVIFLHALYISFRLNICTEKHEMHGFLWRKISKSVFNIAGQARDRSDDSHNECRGAQLFSSNHFQKR